MRSQGAYFAGDWGVIVLCTVFLVPYIFNKCLYFSCYMAGYFMDRPNILFCRNIYLIYHDHLPMSFNILLQYIILSCECALGIIPHSSANLKHWAFRFLEKIQVFKWAACFPEWQGVLGLSAEPKALPGRWGSLLCWGWWSSKEFFALSWYWQTWER